MFSFSLFVNTNRQNETNNFKISYFLYIIYDKKILEVNKKTNNFFKSESFITWQGSFENKTKAAKTTGQRE